MNVASCARTSDTFAIVGEKFRWSIARKRRLRSNFKGWLDPPKSEVSLKNILPNSSSAGAV